MQATIIKRMNPGDGCRQILVRCSPPYLSLYEYIVCSRCNDTCATMQGGPEVYIFAAGNTKGEIIDWTELDGSQKYTEDLELALRQAGYTVTDASTGEDSTTK